MVVLDEKVLSVSEVEVMNKRSKRKRPKKNLPSIGPEESELQNPGEEEGDAEVNVTEERVKEGETKKKKNKTKKTRGEVEEEGRENANDEEKDEEKKKIKVTNEGLQQGYCVVPSAKRFTVLYSFLKRNLCKKVMVFFSNCNSVKFYADLLRHTKVDCMDIHGKQNQQKKTSTFFAFNKAEAGILLCTDVAARGLDIPAVDWIVQYDPPDEPKEYIHRVRRTARGEGGKGNGLLFLIPEELQFLRFLKEEKVPVKEYEFSGKKLANVQSHLEKLVGSNYHLNKSAKEAYRSYLLAYNSHSHKDIFNVHRLDLLGIAASFCFSNPPKVSLNIDSSASKFRKD